MVVMLATRQVRMSTRAQTNPPAAREVSLVNLYFLVMVMVAQSNICKHCQIIQPVVFGADCSPTVYSEGRLREYDHPVVAVEQDCRRLTEERVLFEEGWVEKAQRLKGQCEHAGHEVGEGEEDDEDGGRVPPQLLLRAEDDEGDGVEDGAEDCNYAANYSSNHKVTLWDHFDSTEVEIEQVLKIRI